MRTLITLIVLVVLAIGAFGWANGWVSFSSSDDKATIEIDKEGMQDAANNAEREGREMIEKAGDALEKAGRRIEESADDAEQAIHPD